MKSFGGDTLFAAILAGLFALALFQVSTWPANSRLFALVSAVPGLVLSLVVLVQSRLAPERHPPNLPLLPETEVELPEDVATASLSANALAGAWFLGFFALTALLGLLIAVPVYVFAYLKYGAHESWLAGVFGAVGAWLFVWFLFDWLLKIPLYGGLIGWLAASLT